MSMIIKVIIGILFLAIFFALGSALYYLVTDTTRSNRIIKALTWRIILSMLLFLLLFIAFALGLIHPHAIGAIGGA